MTPLSATLRRYGSGDEQAFRELLEWKFEVPTRYEIVPTTVAELENHVNDSTYNDAGTWDEVRHARNRGVISNEQYLRLCRVLDGG